MVIRMAQLYVTDSKATIGVAQGRIQVKYPDGLLKTLPIESVEGISIFGQAQITTGCIGECLKRGISVQYYSSKGAYFGKLSSTQHVNTRRQKAQAKLSEDKEFSLALAKVILKAKLNNQIVLLRRYSRTSEINISDEVRTIKILEAKIDGCRTIPEAIGYEGNAARTYFKGLSLLVNVPEFKFNGRNRRPPKDRFNSMLSLGYSIMMNEVYGAIEGRGLSPYFGFLHQDREKHPTLASDLMEEWRPVIIDSIVMSMVNGYEISEDNFYTSEENGGVYFDRAGMRKFVSKIEKRLDKSMKYLPYIDYPVSFRRAIDLQALQLCKAIEEGEPHLYQAVIIR